MIGQQILHAALAPPPPSQIGDLRRGRSAVKIEQRNQCLAARCYYYHEFHKLRYDVIVEKLSDEFFLNEVTVGKTIMQLGNVLKELRELKTTIHKLKQDWPHLSW